MDTIDIILDTTGYWIPSMVCWIPYWILDTGYQCHTLACAQAWGWSYLQLPIDLIPDFIPIIGKLDDAFMWLLMIAGVIMMMTGLYMS